MNAPAHPPIRAPVGNPVTPMLRAVLLADLVDSTALIQRFGDARAAAALQRLDLQIRDLLEFTGGRMIDKADGLLAIFERPIQAVDFALRYHQAMRHFSTSEGIALSARVGIHVGELMAWSNSDEDIAAGAKPLEVEGLAKPVAARLMGLALPGQTLVSSMAQSLAQRAEPELGERAARIRWMAHGRFRFKGVPTPLVVHEVGELGFAPLRPPPSAAKAWRDVPLWRRPPVLALEAFCFLAVAAFYGYVALRSAPAIGFAQRDWAVVGDTSDFSEDARFETSLETALKLSLQQSKFVNVVPDTRILEVLQRMGRDGDTVVDRAVGSEIALREGARVLLLPSVTQVGDRLRVGVQVVDPTTRATVYAETADGLGAESALASLDKVMSNLRAEMGESLKDIHATARPLAKVATANVDALQAYTAAMEAMRESRYADAEVLLQHAVLLDPDFAMAIAGLSAIKMKAGQSAASVQLLDRALGLPNRLSLREHALLSMRRARFVSPAQTLRRAVLLTDLYPDEYAGYYEYARTAWMHTHNYAAGLKRLDKALTNKNTAQGSATYLSGVLQLTLGQESDALGSFSRAEALGVRGGKSMRAYAYAAGRQYDQASRSFGPVSLTGLANDDLPDRVHTILFPIDRGELKAAAKAAAALSSEGHTASPDIGAAFKAMELSLRAFDPDHGLGAELSTLVDRYTNISATPEVIDRNAGIAIALTTGLSALRAGEPAIAARALRRHRADAQGSELPTLANLAAMLEAAIAIEAGRAGAAVKLLKPFHDGRELYFSHAILMQALAAENRLAEAALEAQWLRTHRGLAYAEWNSEGILTPANVLMSNLATLHAAAYAARLGQAEQSVLLLKEFKRNWPQGSKLPWVTAQVQRIKRGQSVAVAASK